MKNTGGKEEEEDDDDDYYNNDDDDDEERLCRFCFDGEEEGELVAPCACKSGQRWVHLECLRKWQTAVMHTERAVRCQVCMQPYNCGVPPEPWSHKFRGMRKLGALCVAFFAIFPFYLALFATVCTLYMRAAGVVPVVAGDGGIRLMRQGAPVPSLRRGLFLVSTNDMPQVSGFTIRPLRRPSLIPLFWYRTASSRPLSYICLPTAQLKAQLGSS